MRDYIVRLVTATRDPAMAGVIAHAVSPRGTLALAAAAKAKAFLAGRDYAVPDDVIALAADALSHRLVLAWKAAADGETARAVIGKLIERIEPL